MRRFLPLIGAAWIGTTGLAVADTSPIVVELYTSQGCSSCPPADAFLHELAKRPDVIALALHVDYWDYIGWKDKFATPEYSARQRSYARAAGARTVYTPQMVIGGQDHVIGSNPGKVLAIVGAHKAKAQLVDLEVKLSAEKVRLSAKTDAALGPVLVQVVTFSPLERVAIKRGENAGRTLDYNNVVTAWTVVRKWNGRGTLTMTVDIPTTGKSVVILQKDNHGEILAAAKLN